MNKKTQPKPSKAKKPHPWRVYDTGYFARAKPHAAMPAPIFRVLPR